MFTNSIFTYVFVLANAFRFPDTLRHGKNQDILDTIAGIAVKGGILLMEAGENISLADATLEH